MGSAPPPGPAARLPGRGAPRSALVRSTARPASRTRSAASALLQLYSPARPYSRGRRNRRLEPFIFMLDRSQVSHRPGPGRTARHARVYGLNFNNVSGPPRGGGLASGWRRSGLLALKQHKELLEAFSF
eukprot:674936-Prymnesium_polylepis.2